MKQIFMSPLKCLARFGMMLQRDIPPMRNDADLPKAVTAGDFPLIT